MGVGEEGGGILFGLIPSHASKSRFVFRYVKLRCMKTNRQKKMCAE